MDQLLLWPPVSSLPSFTPKEKAHDHSKQRASSSFLESNHKYTARNISPFFSLKTTHTVGKEIKIKRSIKKTGWNITQRTIDRRNNLRKEKKMYTMFFATDISISRIFSSFAIILFSRLKKTNELNARKLNEHLSFFIDIHVFRARISGQINVAFFPK